MHILMNKDIQRVITYYKRSLQSGILIISLYFIKTIFLVSVTLSGAEESETSSI